MSYLFYLFIKIDIFVLVSRQKLTAEKIAKDYYLQSAFLIQFISQILSYTELKIWFWYLEYQLRF